MVPVARYTGHEEEFRVLFAQEAETRLARLARQLIELEEAGPAEELVASIFRDAHTLKGAAAVVGFDQVSRAAHALEEVLEGVRAGTRAPTPALVDVLLTAVDRLGELVRLALAGEDTVEGADEIEAVLGWAPPGGGAPGRGPAAAGGPGGDAAAAGGPSPQAAAGGAEPGGGPRAARAETETVRIPVERLDELIRLVGESAAAHLRVGRLLNRHLGVDPGTVAEYRELSRILAELQERAMRARMVPVATIVEPVRRAVRDLSRSLGKRVRVDVRGEDTELDRNVLEHLSDPLLQLVRNAVDHGIEAPEERLAAGKPEEGVVSVHAMQLGSEVIIVVGDDGRGIDLGDVRQAAARLGDDLAGTADDDAVYAIFRSGLSTAGFVSDISGRGVGLDVVRASLDGVRGRIDVDTRPGQGSEFRMAVPITLAVLPCLMVEVSGHPFAVPMHSVVTAVEPQRTDEVVVEGAPSLWVGRDALPLSDLAVTLDLGDAHREGPVVVVSGLTRRHAFRVDALLGQREVVVKGLGRLVPRLDVLTGASVEPDGSVMLVLDPSGVIERARRLRRPGPADGDRAAPATAVVGGHDPAGTGGAPPAPEPWRGRVLVVDDALTVRELQRSILERAGYEVRLAADGDEALALLADGPVDLVLTDVEMPGVDGFALTEAIRAQPRLAGVPVLMLTTRTSDDDRRRGLEVGADGYIVKHAFDESALLAAVERLMGTR